MNNDVMFCPTSSASCYYHQAAGVNNANAVTACTTMGGRLVSWNTEDEQLQVGESMPAGCNRLQQMKPRIDMARSGTPAGFLAALGNSLRVLPFLQVERYFAAVNGLTSYWISMYKTSNVYFWADGSYIGDMIPRRANPYVHVRPNTPGAGNHCVS